MVYQKIAQQLVAWLREQVKEAGARGCVLGISGGVDSAVVAALCIKACPGEVLGLHLPCYSSSRDTEDARLLAEVLPVQYKEFHLDKIYDAAMTTFAVAGTPDASRAWLASGNLKARLRMATLYYYAQLYNYLVIGTGNRSELEVGYFTKYGDGGVDLLPLAGLVKTQVWELARHLGLPEEIIEKPPTAGLWQGQTDEGELGFTYQQLDQILLTGTGEARVVAQVNKRREASRHKLRTPAIPELDFSPVHGQQ